MTILHTVEPRVNGFHKNSPSKLLYKEAIPAVPVSSTQGRPGLEPAQLMRKFVKQYNELQNYKNGDTITLDGHSLSIPAVVAAARCHATVTLSDAADVKDRVQKSRKVVEDKVAGEMSVYGVSTGFGGSADTRTANTLALGSALLQHQHAGVLPSSTSSPLPMLPLSDPLTSTSMPESWVRGALLIRMNSLIRGHSGVRFELIEKMSEFLQANITPMIPLRGSISASGDLQPLSYIAGAISGNPSIRCFDGPAMIGARQIVSSRDALARHSIEPINLAAKEHLGILNGTAFSASVAALALNDAVHMGMLAQVCTAMGTEALLGVRGNYHPFISETARPHPGQIEVSRTIWDLLEGSKLALTHETEVTIEEDDGELRQDRYPLRTTPQFLGPQIEDLLTSLETITLECNSTTDNPLFDGETGEVHHGGNFQAMAVTNVMEKTRLSLHHIGKLMFAQATELINPMMNRGLPSCLAATDPSLNYHAKGLDIASASYVSELGYLANPVSTHIQSAEMHNQAVNSLALISGRATISALEVLSLLISTYLYLLCQALDIRALQLDFRRGLTQIVEEEVQSHFGAQLASADTSSMRKQLVASVYKTLDATSSVDAPARMEKVAAASSSALVDHFVAVDASALSALPAYREAVARRATSLINELREDYLSGKKGPAPASAYLHKTRPVYEFVRIGLGVRMHGSENQSVFANGLGVEEVTIGQNVSLIHEAIRDGKMQGVVAGLFA